MIKLIIFILLISLSFASNSNVCPVETIKTFTYQAGEPITLNCEPPTKFTNGKKIDEIILYSFQQRSDFNEWVLYEYSFVCNISINTDLLSSGPNYFRVNAATIRSQLSDFSNEIKIELVDGLFVKSPVLR